MGRKGSGRAGFMKASRKGPDSDDEQPQQEPVKQAPAAAAASLAATADVAAKPAADAPPVISKKASAFLKDVGGEASASDDDDEFTARNASGETRGQLQQRHKREAKAMKDQAKRLGKKGKDEAAKLEAEMRGRHAAELEAFNAPAATAEVTQSMGAASLEDGEQGGGGGGGKEKKLTKAQKRRDQRAKEDAERDERIAAELAELGETERMAEERELKTLLAPLGLAVKDIPPDGHCLYRSLEHQLEGLPDGGTAALAAAGCEGPPAFLELRKLAAGHMRSNADHFRHFVVKENDSAAAAGAAAVEEGEAGGEDPSFEAYCTEVESTAAWGGHVEIQALSQVLAAHVRVFCAGREVVDIGEEFKGKGGPTLHLCYLRHAYGLGEHYNSVMETIPEEEGEGEEEAAEAAAAAAAAAAADAGGEEES